MEDRKQSAAWEEVSRLYHSITTELIRTGRTISTMESCTSGLIASLLTDTEGSSAVTKGSFVTYSNFAKIRQGVAASTIETYGVYSRETAAEMASCARAAYGADIGIGVTGSFGNTDPANADSVPGQVFFAIDVNGAVSTYEEQIPPQESRLAYKLYMAALIGREGQALLAESA